MLKSRSNLVLTTILVFGAVVFGMVIAGSSRITTPGFAAPGPQKVAATASPQASLPNFADLAEAVLPAVASVKVVTIQRADSRRSTPFEFFFPNSRRGDPQERQQEFRSEGAGSAFVISPDGWIVTNHHVIDRATEVEVTLEGKRYVAQVRGADPSTDLALLKVDVDHELKYLALGDSDALRVGDWVMAIGNPHQLAQSVTVGVVSAKDRSNLGLSDVSFENFIQTDAAINRGNSGGPLVNLAGEVVGISVAMNFGAENIGFAVPVNTLRAIVDQLQSDGRVRRGYLGVTISNLDDDAAEAFGVDSTDGALVNSVVKGGPADEAGLRNGDIIVQVDEHPVRSTRSLIDYVSAKPPGDRVDVALIRGRRRVEHTITLAERPGEQVASVEVEPRESEHEWLGLQYQELTPGLREMHGIGPDVQGVLVTDVAASSPLVDEGVAPGVIITEVNGEPANDSETFASLVSQTAPGSFLRFYVRRFSERGENSFFAFVRVP